MSKTWAGRGFNSLPWVFCYVKMGIKRQARDFFWDCHQRMGGSLDLTWFNQHKLWLTGDFTMILPWFTDRKQWQSWGVMWPFTLSDSEGSNYTHSWIRPCKSKNFCQSNMKTLVDADKIYIYIYIYFIGFLYPIRLKKISIIFGATSWV